MFYKNYKHTKELSMSINPEPLLILHITPRSPKDGKMAVDFGIQSTDAKAVALMKNISSLMKENANINSEPRSLNGCSAMHIEGKESDIINQTGRIESIFLENFDEAGDKGNTKCYWIDLSKANELLENYKRAEEDRKKDAPEE
jgi:hypothetical protein